MNKKCPECGEALADIIYGFPTSECLEAQKRKEVYLGGCCLPEDGPKYHCYNCDLDFSEDLAKIYGTSTDPTTNEPYEAV